MKLKIVPFNGIDSAILIGLCNRINKIFGFEAIIGSEVPIPMEAFSRERNQYNAVKLLDRLSNGTYNDEFKVIALTNKDIYVDGLNFAFGIANVKFGVALVSLSRLREEFYGRPEDRKLFYLRLLKEVIHEIGHLMGLAHCSDNRCVMYFSNSLHDTDIKEAFFCIKCQPKLVK